MRLTVDIRFEDLEFFFRFLEFVSLNVNADVANISVYLLKAKISVFCLMGLIAIATSVPQLKSSQFQNILP